MSQLFYKFTCQGVTRYVGADNRTEIEKYEKINKEGNIVVTVEADEKTQKEKLYKPEEVFTELGITKPSIIQVQGFNKVYSKKEEAQTKTK